MVIQVNATGNIKISDDVSCGIINVVLDIREALRLDCGFCKDMTKKLIADHFPAIFEKSREFCQVEKAISCEKFDEYLKLVEYERMNGGNASNVCSKLRACN